MAVQALCCQQSTSKCRLQARCRTRTAGRRRRHTSLHRCRSSENLYLAERRLGNVLVFSSRQCKLSWRPLTASHPTCFGCDGLSSFTTVVPKRGHFFQSTSGRSTWCTRGTTETSLYMVVCHASFEVSQSVHRHAYADWLGESALELSRMRKEFWDDSDLIYNMALAGLDQVIKYWNCQSESHHCWIHRDIQSMAFIPWLLCFLECFL